MAIDSNDKFLKLIGRDEQLFREDLSRHGSDIDALVRGASFLVVGGAGSIGSAVVRELFRRDPAVLHVIDTSENGLAELVRDLRASLGYIKGDFHAYCFDALGSEFDAFTSSLRSNACKYDYVLNFSALKHVRSEKDPFTLMRMIDVNVFLTCKLKDFADKINAKKFFCVSTDKAANPVNMMGASKRIMEMFLSDNPSATPVSTARFANVAFSDGSLPQAWTQRLAKQQPIAAPNDVKRYFVTPQESAYLCLFSILQGADREIFFPKLSPRLHLITFSSMAERYLQSLGWEPYICETEDEARDRVGELSEKHQWPCFFFASDTTGEKDFEEFYTDAESVQWERYHEIAVVENTSCVDSEKLRHFSNLICEMRKNMNWTKEGIISAFDEILPNFAHKETGKSLDNRM
jgi:FlaA1/EpsC-like NDP-sugar epimerase